MTKGPDYKEEINKLSYSKNSMFLQITHCNKKMTINDNWTILNNTLDILLDFFKWYCLVEERKDNYQMFIII